MITTLLAVTLSGVSASPATVVPAKPAAEKQICRKYTDTGSFVRKSKVCRTAAEWRLQEQEARERGREMQGNGRPTGGG